MTNTGHRMLRTGAALLVAIAAAACAGPDPADQVEVEIRGTDPALAALPSADPGARGIVDYGDYAVVVAEQGDTVAEVAARAGLSPTELAAYNGVQPSTELRAGDELVLPPGTDIDAADVVEEDFEIAALPGADAVEMAPLAPPDPAVAAALEPVEVEPEELEPMIAEPVEPSAPPLAPAPEPATGRAWSPDLAAAAIDRSDEPLAQGLPPPPSAGQPLPPAPDEPRALASPDLARYQSPGLATPFQLTPPVQGPVAVPYNVGAGPERNEGVDFAAQAGAPVVAAEDGEVALVSESLGGLGTIVLIRHPNDMMTVYGRLGQVSVEKGDYLERGQQFGVVANPPAGTEPRMHFEVRSGADSVDPMEML